MKKIDLTISRELTALDIDDWDSFNHVNLIVETETTSNIKLALGKLQELKHIGVLEDLIVKILTS